MGAAPTVAGAVFASASLAGGPAAPAAARRAPSTPARSLCRTDAAKTRRNWVTVAKTRSTTFQLGTAVVSPLLWDCALQCPVCAGQWLETEGFGGAPR